MKTGKSLQELAAEIERRAASKKDLVAPTQHISMVPYEDYENKSGVALRVGDQKFGINGIAHDQIGTYTGIPAKYYDLMKAEKPHLLAQNVNAWMNGDNKKARL